MKAITNEIEYKAIVKRLNELMEIVTDENYNSIPEAIELDFLSDLVEDYEKKYYPKSVQFINKFKIITMEEKKTKIADFIAYLDFNLFVSGRVITALQSINEKLHKEFNNIDYIEDIEYINFAIMRNVGKKSWFEFTGLREDYKQHINELERKNKNNYRKPCISDLKEDLRCWLHSDVFQTLNSIDNKDIFVELALLEKFERDRIQLVCPKEK